jgi:hypothetical protein
LFISPSPAILPGLPSIAPFLFASLPGYAPLLYSFIPFLPSFFRYNPQSDAQSRNKVGVFLQHLTTSMNTWKRVPQAITQTQDEYTSFLLLQILEQVTKYRWESLAADERSGMRVFVTQIITKTVEEPNAMQQKVRALVVCCSVISALVATPVAVF